jgi:V8-like Glu-specific endopeptidase
MPADSTSYPYDTMVFITDTIGSGHFQASGVLISPDEVLTASHVVYSSTDGTASNIEVKPAYDMGTAPFGSAAGTFFHYNQIQDANDRISPQQSQSDYAVIHLSRPFTGLGTMGLLANFQGGAATVTGYPAASGGALVSSQQNVVTDPYYTLLDGTSIGPGSSGGPMWITDSSGVADVVGLVSTGGDSGSVGFFTQITTTVLDQIEAWVRQDDASAPSAPSAPSMPSAPSLAVLDTTTGQAVAATAQPYTGPVAGLQEQYINVTSDNLNISAGTPNWFIHSGGGNDAVAVNSGTNVLDGGTGSNFLVGGSGTDTFFVDDRAQAADTWSTLSGFHAGDAATIWGVTPSDFSVRWVDGQGASGHTGLTLHAAAAGKPNASLTLAGYASADLADGRLSVSFGTDAASGSAYMYVHGDG